MNTKICNACKTEKPVSEFQRTGRQGTPDVWRSKCKECTKAGRMTMKSLDSRLSSFVPEGYRICTNCSAIKPLEEFFPSTSERSACKACVQPILAAQKRFRQTGWTDIEYMEAFANQNGVCAICHQPDQAGIALAADHCHKTGAKRGLLCRRCNQVLGLFDDDPELFARAISYLAEAARR
jgi:hypothetical protein